MSISHIYACTLILAACPVLAQGLTSVIFFDQKPIAKVYPPTAAVQSAPGTGKFVLLTRTEVSKKGEWDFLAEAWECIPSRPDIPVTKRVEFCHSSWNANLLLNSLVPDGSRHMHPRFLRLQVYHATDRYGVNLYDINYRTWDVKCIWQGRQALPFGILGDAIHCQSGMTIDVKTGSVSETFEFVPLEVLKPFWLVRKTGEKDGSWSFDTHNRKYIAYFHNISEKRALYSTSWIAPNGRSRVSLLANFAMGSDDVEAKLVVQRDGVKDDLIVPVEFKLNAAADSRCYPVISV